MAKESNPLFENSVERVYSLLISGYSFMFRAGAKEGHWHETRSTALAGICLEFREYGDSPWLRTVRQRLLDTQIKEGRVAGSWGEEVWDTAMAIIALKYLGVHSKDESIQRALKWMAGLYSVSGRECWHDEPWETSWALMAFLSAGVIIPPVNVVKSVRWLIHLQASDGSIISPHYTAYLLQIHQALNMGKIDVEASDLDAISGASLRAANYLVQLLEQSSPERLWTGEAWSNGQILWSLTKSNSLPLSKDSLLHKTLHWFETAQEADGNWSDIEDTASAIIGLHSLLDQLLLSLEGKRFRKLIGEESEKEIYAQLRKRLPTPRLYGKLPLIERQKETGGISINFSHRLLTIISIVILLATIAATATTLLDFIWNH